jgi:PKD repeat protein
LECKGGSWQNEQFDLDIGNFWDFGDGNNSTLPNPRNQFSSLGKFQVSLVVMDPFGAISTDSLEVQVILRTYEIQWNTEQREEIIESNKYTREGDTSEILRLIYQEQLGMVNVSLNWTDLQPLLKNNQSAGEDLFELDILTPENISKIQNSTSGNISITIEYKSSILPQIYKAKTKNEAISLAIDDANFNNEGNGEWRFNVSALECKGGSWQNEQFDLDIGNFWDLEIVLVYYVYELNEITYDELE